MDATQLELLHEHYRDSCNLMQGQRAARDRYFYFVIAVIAVTWFDVVAPRDFSAVAGELVKAKLQLPVAPDLAYLRSVLWFILLGLTVRYFQASLSVERSYDYIHDVERILAEDVHQVFGREGAAYLSKYPLFLKWAHHLYVIVSPVLLLAVVWTWTRAQIPHWEITAWSGLVWFDSFVSLAIVVSVILYWAFRVDKKDGSPAGARARRGRSGSRP